MLRRSPISFCSSSSTSAALADRSRLFARIPLSSSSTSSQKSKPTNFSPFASSPLKNGGMCFESEDRQSGMLFTLSAIEEQHQQRNLSSSSSSGKNKNMSGKTNIEAMRDKNQIVFVKEGYNSVFAKRRLGAVVKGTSADWQVSEIYTSLPSSSSFVDGQQQDDENLGISSYSSSLPHLGSRLLLSSSNDSNDDASASASFFSSVVTVTRTPKGAWKKIAPALKKEIETDDKVSYSDPNKHFRELYITQGAYAYKKGSIPVDRNVLEFSLYRENTPLRAVMRRMAKKLKMVSDEKMSQQHGEDFFVISMKESYGCVNQLGRIRNISFEMLPHASRHYNIHPILFNPLKYLPTENTMVAADQQTTTNSNSQNDNDGETNSSSSSSLLSSNFTGNRWRVMLRCVDGSKAEIEDNLCRLSEKGAINYFPLRNLGGGAAGGSATDIHTAVADGRYFDACRFWLQNEGAKDYLFRPHYSAYLAADSSSVGGILEIATKDLKDSKANPYLIRATKFLSEIYHNSNSNKSSSSSSYLSDEVCKELWEDTIRHAVDPIAIREAPDNFLWNLAVSQRLYKYGTDRVVKGDYVIAFNDSKNGASVMKRVESDEEGRKYRVDRHLVIPFASNYSSSSSSSSSSSPCWYEDFYKSAAEKFDISLEKCSVFNSQQKQQNQQKRFRRAILKPTTPMQAVVVEDPNSLSIIKTDLFLRQERKNANSDVTLEERFRSPTLYNVSDAFRSLMQDAIHNPPPSSSSSSSYNNNSRCSVAIEVDLPVGSHVLSFLREGFLLRHIHSSDQMDIVAGY